MKEVADFFVQHCFIFDPNNIDFQQKDIEGKTPYMRAIAEGLFDLAIIIFSLEHEKLDFEIKGLENNLDETFNNFPSILQFSALDEKMREDVDNTFQNKGDTRYFNETTLDGNKNVEGKKDDHNVSNSNTSRDLIEVGHETNPFDKECKKLFQDLLQVIEDGNISQSMECFKHSEQEFEKIANAISDHFQKIRNLFFANNHCMPFEPDPHALQAIYDKIQVTFNFFVDHLTIESQKSLPLNTLINIHVIAEICEAFWAYLEQRVTPTHPLIEKMQNLVKEIKKHFVEVSYVLEEELKANLNQQRLLEEMACYLNHLSIELSARGAVYTEWLEECTLKRSEILTQQKASNEKMMILIREMRLGLTVTQQFQMKDRLLLLIADQKNALSEWNKGDQLANAIQVPFEKSVQDFLIQNSDLFQVLYNRAYHAGQDLYADLLKYIDRACTEQISFIEEEQNFIETFCRQNALSNFEEITLNNFNTISMMSYVTNPFTDAAGYKVFFSTIEDQKNRLQVQIQEIENAIEQDKKEEQAINEEYQKTELHVFQLKQNTDELINRQNQILSEVNVLKRNLLSFSPSIYSQNNNDVFSDVTMLLDSLPSELESRLADLYFKLNIVLENYNFKQEMEQSALTEIHEESKLNTEITFLSQNIATLKAIIPQYKQNNELYQNEYMENQFKLEDLSFESNEKANILTNQMAEKEYFKEQIQFNAKSLQLYRREYFHTYNIEQQLNLRMLMFGKFLSMQEEENPDFMAARARVGALKALEDTCQIIVGCVIDAFSDTFDPDLKILRENLAQFTNDIKKACNFFLEQLTIIYKQAGYQSTFIEIISTHIQELQDAFVAPCIVLDRNSSPCVNRMTNLTS